MISNKSFNMVNTNSATQESRLQQNCFIRIPTFLKVKDTRTNAFLRGIAWCCGKGRFAFVLTS